MFNVRSVASRVVSCGCLLLCAVVAPAADATGTRGPSAARSARSQDVDAAVRLFADAQRLAEDGDLEAALRNYQLLVQQFPQAPIADDALLLTAEGRWRLGDRAAAEVAIASLKEDYPRTPGTAGAFVLEGNIRMATAVGPSDLEAAREAFRSVVLLYGRDDFPELDWRAQAQVRAGEASVLMGEFGEAAAHFLAAVEDEARSRWAQPARLQLATIFMRSGEWAAAAEILQRIVDTGGDMRVGGAVEGGDPSADADAAASGVDEVDRASEAKIASAARRRLELGHRLMLRPSLALLPWQGARQVRISGPKLDEPDGVAASEDNRLVIVDTGIPLLAVLEPDGSLSHRVPSSEAFHPWWGRGNAPYVSTRRSVLNLESRERQDFSAPDNDEIKEVEGITAGAHGVFGQWFVLDRERKQVQMHDRAAEFVSFLMDGNDVEPVDVAVDHRGRIHVLDRKQEAVVRFAADGSESVRLVQRDWRRPEAIAIDGLDNIYVLDRDAKTIEVFSPEGELRWQLGPELPGGLELKSPRDLGIDGSGRIYVVDRDLKAFLVIE